MGLNLLALGLSGVTIGWLVWWWRGVAPAWDWTDCLGACLVAPGIITLWLLVVAVAAAAPAVDWNAARLTWTFSLRYGYRLFYPATEGPILSSVYGPVGALAFLPATLFHTPTTAVLAAAALELVFVLGAMLAFVWHAGGRAATHRPLAVAGGLSASLLLVRTQGSYQWLSIVHPDGVALALGLLACAPLTPVDRTPPTTRGLLASATAAVLACWAKQIAAPLPLALVFAVWLIHGRRLAMAYALRIGAVGVAVSVAMLATFGTPMLFNMFVLMGSQPWYRPGLAGPLGQLRHLGLHTWDLLALLAVGLTTALGSPLRRKLASSWMPPLLVAVFLLPTGALGANKIGGEESSFHSIYYLVAAIAMLFVETGTQTRMGRLLAAALLTTALVGAWRSDRYTLWGPRPSVWDNHQQRAYDFAVRHPGEAYFPGQPLASLLAEGRLYHFEYAVADRYFAGYEPSPAHLRANLPPRLRWIAGPAPLWTFHYFPEFSEETTLPELPGWSVRTRPPS